MAVIKIDARKLKEERSFHKTFAKKLGFPGFYGQNMDAWIDCMSYLDDPSAEMTNVHVKSPEVLVLHLDMASDFKKRCPELFVDLVECAAFVNYRRLDMNRPAVLALSFHA